MAHGKGGEEEEEERGNGKICDEKIPEGKRKTKEEILIQFFAKSKP